MDCENCRHFNAEKAIACTNIWVSEGAKPELLERNGQGCSHFLAQNSYQNINFGKINIPDFNVTALIIKLIGWLVLIGGLVYGIMMGKNFAAFSWAVAGVNWAAAFFGAMMFFGFGEIIRLLYRIDRKLQQDK